MAFELKDVVGAVGPSAALAFAAWLFLQLLQQRYSAAYSRYRELVDAMRGSLQGKRREVVKNEIDVYRKRVRLMMWATNIGLVAAILLVLALVVSGLDAMLHIKWLKYIGGPAIVLGLLLVLPAAVMVIAENAMIARPIDAELADLQEYSGGNAQGARGMSGRDGADVRGREPLPQQ